MLILTVILLTLAFLCFAAATFGVSANVNLVAAGLAFWVLSVVIGSVGIFH